MQTQTRFYAERLALTALDLAVKRPARNLQCATVDTLQLMTHARLLGPRTLPVSRAAFAPIPCHADKDTLGRALWSPQGIACMGFEELGRGGGGKVYLATLTGAGVGRLVALKKVHLNSTDGKRYVLPQQALRRAMMEFEIMRITGSKLAPAQLFISRGRQDAYGSLYAVMPPLRGDAVDITNNVRIHAPDVTPLWARHVLHSILRTLVSMHEQEFVHADVKPENILLDFDGEPHLADYGLASHATAKQTRRGSLEFAAPEVLMAASHNDAGFDTRADVYSAAITIVSILARNPLEGPLDPQTAELNEWEAADLRRDLHSWQTEERLGMHLPLRGRRTVPRRAIASTMEQARRQAPSLFPLLVAMLALNPGERPRAREALIMFEGLGLGLALQERATLDKALLQLDMPVPPPGQVVVRAMHG